MKNTIMKMLIALLAIALTATAVAQDDQTQTQTQTQQTQPTRAQSQDMHAQDVQDALMELRQLHDQLGQVIRQLESGLSGFEMLEERITRVEQQTRLSTLRETQRQLEDLRADIEAGEVPEDAAITLGTVRADLRSAYQGASEQDREAWTTLDEDFAVLEEQIRAGSTDATTTIQNVSDRLSQEIDRTRRAQEERAQQAQQSTFRQARQRLENLRQDIESGERAEQTANELMRIRMDLQRTDVDVENQERFDEFTSNLQQLEQQVRAGETNAVDTYESVLEDFDRFGATNERPDTQDQTDTDEDDGDSQ